MRARHFPCQIPILELAMSEPAGEWLGTEAAAEYLGVSRRTLLRWRVQNMFRQSPFPQIPWQVDANGRAKYRRADLDEYRRRNPNGPWRPGKR